MPTGIYPHKPRSEETRQKISQTEKGKFISGETRVKLSRNRLGKFHSEESKAKIGLAHLGTRHKGWHFSEETKRMFASLWTEERREGKRKQVLGTTHATSQLTKEKISSALKGNPNLGGHLHSEETKQKIAATKAGIAPFRGENHPNWKGGISNEPYPFEFNEELKEKIRERDGRKCQRCGVPEIECFRALDIHHIDYNKDNIEEGNLIALCTSCNPAVNYNRDYWRKYFTSMLKGEKGEIIPGSGCGFSIT